MRKGGISQTWLIHIKHSFLVVIENNFKNIYFSQHHTVKYTDRKKKKSIGRICNVRPYSQSLGIKISIRRVKLIEKKLILS